ncbi:MAG: O-antigen ligase family protein [Bacteroidetes bacterium]|nr:O-antigen ligase family protein [Bacteroidota bacterium]
MNKKFEWRALGRFKWIYILIGISWILLLITQDEFTSTLESVFKSSVAISTFLLLIPTLSHPLARKILFYAILYTAFMRCIVIIDYAQYDILYSESLHGFGKDKNYSGMLLAMGTTLLLPFILSKKVSMLYRLFSSGLSIWFLYWIFNTGSRSAVVTVFASVLAIGYLYIVKVRGVTVKLRMVVLGFVIVVFSVSAIQSLTDKYGVLQENFIRLIEFVNGERADINGRLELFNMAVTKIIENPIIGSGYGSSEYMRGKRALTHNSFVAQWIETGLLGILSLFLFVIFVWKEIKQQIENMNYEQEQRFDLALSLSGIPFIMMLMTLNMGTMIYFMIYLYATFEWERYYLKSISNRKSIVI